MEWSGDRVAGTAELFDSYEVLPDPIEVTFDVEVPAEILDCGL